MCILHACGVYMCMGGTPGYVAREVHVHLRTCSPSSTRLPPSEPRWQREAPPAQRTGCMQIWTNACFADACRGRT